MPSVSGKVGGNMVKTFDLGVDTTPIAEYEFPVLGQFVKAKVEGCEKVFRFRNIHSVSYLPQYIRTAIFNAGYEAVIVGSSSFKYTIIGLKKAK